MVIENDAKWVTSLVYMSSIVCPLHYCLCSDGGGLPWWHVTPCQRWRHHHCTAGCLEVHYTVLYYLHVYVWLYVCSRYLLFHPTVRHGPNHDHSRFHNLRDLWSHIDNFKITFTHGTGWPHQVTIILPWMPYLLLDNFYLAIQLLEEKKWLRKWNSLQENQERKRLLPVSLQVMWLEQGELEKSMSEAVLKWTTS